MRDANANHGSRWRLLPRSAHLKFSIAAALVVCLPHLAHAQPPAANGSLAKDLQADLQALAAMASAQGDQTSMSGLSLDGVLALLERIRATDLLIQGQQRSIDERLQRAKVSAGVLQRQQEQVRMFRERMDRLYRASDPLTAEQPTAAAVRAAFAAILETLFDALDTETRTPIGAILPYRSLAWPQVAPRPGTAVTPAYLTTPVQAPQAADLAETPDTLFSGAIRSQAAALSQDAIAIFEFVQHGVRTEFYYGAMKDGAETLRQASGNDTDQASLLIALLRASQVPARYVRGVIRLTGAQAAAWTAAGSAARAAAIFTRAGIPFRPILQGGSIGAFEIEHTWVEAYVPYSNYRGVRLGTIGRAWIPLDPSFKTVDVTPGEDVLAAMGFNAAGTVANYLAQTQPLAPMEFYRQAISDYLTQTGSPLTFEDVLSTRTTRATPTGLLPGTLPYAVVSIDAESPALPDSLRHRVRFVVEGDGGTSFDVTVPATELAGRRLTLSYIPATVEDQAVAHSFLGLDNTPAYLVKLRPVLKIGGVVKAAGSTPVQMGAFHVMTVEIQTPRGAVPVVNSMLAGGYYALGLATEPAAYTIPLARAPDDTEHPAADRLYSIAIDYIRRWNDAEHTLERLLRVVNVRPALSHVIVGTVHARTVLFGQPQAIEWRGVFVDADLRVAEPVPTGDDDIRAPEFMRLSGLAGSMLEADVLTLNIGEVGAISTASVIPLARASGIPIEEVTAANLTDVLTRLQTADLIRTEVADAVGQGWRVSIPQRDLTYNSWTGIGYVMSDPATGASGYFISGGLAGGTNTFPPAEWPDDPAELFSSPNSEPANPDPLAVRFLTKVAITDKQNGIVGQPLERELAVWARDEDGLPVKDAPVTFYAEFGGGHFPGEAQTVVVTTDHRGIARTPFTLGSTTAQLPFFVRVRPDDPHVTQVGQNIVNAVVIGAQPVFISIPFQHFAHPGPPSRIVKVLGDHTAPPGTLGTLEPGLFGGSLLARVEDAHGNPISNVPIDFTVHPAEPILPALPATAFPPPGAINLRLYAHDPPCAVATPVLGDCNAVDTRLTATSSAFGAAVNTILGNTAGTVYRVEASIPDQTQVGAQQFELRSRLARGFGNGVFYAPELMLSLPQLVNDRGNLVNAAPAGTTLSRPLEALLMLREDDYTIQQVAQECSEPEAVCYAIRSLETSRVRPIDVAGPGTVVYPAYNGAVTGLRSFETATVNFTPAPGLGAVTTPPQNAGGGRYSSSLTLGVNPAQNTVAVTALARVLAPCINLKTGAVVLRQVELRAGQNIAADSMFYPQGDSQYESCGTAGTMVAIGDTQVERHVVFGVRATVQDTAVPVSPDTLSQDGRQTAVVASSIGIEYRIEPPTYVATVADVDIFEMTAADEHWKGALPGASPAGSSYAVLPQGTGFDAAKSHQAQLVLNRGTGVEIRSERARLRLTPPSNLQTSEGVVVRTYLDSSGSSCAVPSDGLGFFISRDARITIHVDGSILRGVGPEGPFAYDNRELPGGAHFAGIHPSVVAAPGRHTFTVTAVFPAIGGEPEIVRTVTGPILHDVVIMSTLPVGHTLVAGTDLATGALALAREDVVIPGHGPRLEFRRSYSSAGTRSSGPMGAGWSHNFESRVVIDPCGGLTLVGGEGSGTRFESPVAQNGITTYSPRPGFHGSLSSTDADGSYDYITPQGARHHYERVASPGDSQGQPVFHRLAFIEDRNGNRLTLTYDAAPPFNLTTVSDAAGRTLTFSYQVFGEVPEPRITEVRGPLDLLVTFEYDTHGNLRRATRGPRTERYDYETGVVGRHNLVRIIGPNNVVNASADITTIAYHTAADDIPGLPPGSEPWEIVRSQTAGPDTPEAATHQYSYDFSTHQTTLVDPRGTTTRYTMEPQYGAVTEKRVVLDSGENVTSTRWAFQDGINDIVMTRTVDAVGRVTTYQYDGEGNPTTTSIDTRSVPYAEVTRGDGTPVATVTATDAFHPRFGTLTRSVDAEGRITEYEVDDANGNVRSKTVYPGGGIAPLVTRFAYVTSGPLRGLLKTTTDPRGEITTHDQFDAFGHPTSVIDPEGNVTTNVYDARGRLRQRHDTLGHHTVYDYDDLDRVTSVTDTSYIQPADIEMASTPERRTSTTYLPGGQPATVTDGNGHVTEYEYDALNRQIRQRNVVTDADGNSTMLQLLRTYDGNGNKLTEVDRRGIEHRFEYDNLNRLTTARVAGQVVATNTYDAAGNRLTETDLHGHTTSFHYDALYRRIRTDLPLAPLFTTAAYDLAGNLLRETDANHHARVSTYDGVNRLIRTTDAVGVTHRYEYDGSGNRTLEENQTTGLRIETEYDGLSRPIVVRQQFTDPLTGQSTVYTTQIAHLDAEHTKVTTSPRGVVARERFNGHDALIERVLDAGAAHPCVPAPGGPTCLQTTYRYNGNGFVTAEKDSAGGVIDKIYEYDALNRQIAIAYPLAAEERWFYDGNGNVVRAIDRRGVERRFEYDSFDRPTRNLLIESISNAGRELITTENAYDDAANAVTVVDANRNATRQWFDPLHRPTRQLDALNRETSTEWDGVHVVARVDHARNIRTELVNDAIGRVVEKRRSSESGAVVERTEYVDAASRQIDTDPNGVVTINQMDALGRLRRVSKRAAALAASYGAIEIAVDEREYDGHGMVTRSIDGNGQVTSFQYDGGDRTVRVTEAVGTPVEASTVYTYDRADNLLTTKDGRAHARSFDHRYTYDVRDRRVLAENAAGGVAAYRYDQSDNLVAVTEPNSALHSTVYSYDESNNLLSVDETRGGVGGVTRYLYDANRNRIAQQDANGNLTTYAFDSRNRMTDLFQHSVAGTLAEGSTRSGGAGGEPASARRWRYEYDAAGNQTLVIDALGQRVEKTYDPLDRLVRKIYQQHQPDASGNAVYPRPTSIVYQYDNNGNIVRVDETKESGPGQIVTERSTMQYDPLNRLVSQTNADNKTVQFEYDRAGNQKAVIDADGARLELTFDAKNRPTAATEGALTTQFTYWPDDLMRSVIHPGGVVSESSYDAADRVLRIANSAGPGPISDYEYTYDANGNRLTQMERHTSLFGGAAQRTSYQYDAANRLTGAATPSTPAVNYTYARNGNRLSEVTAPSEGGDAVELSYGYDRFNQLTSIADAINPAASVALRYDRNGNTIERRVGALDAGGEVPAPVETRTFAWTIRDHLARASGAGGAVAFDYDHIGRRVTMTTPAFAIRYLYDNVGVIQEYDAGSRLTTLSYRRGPGGLFAMNTAGPASQRFSFIGDGLGSTSELTNGQGATQASYSYDPFGKARQQFDLSPNRRTFTGQYRDNETGLYYMGARYYDERTGRFLSQDPFHGDVFVPASLNRYTYAHNNPTLFVDPDGRVVNLGFAAVGLVGGGLFGCAAGALSGNGCLKGAVVGAAAGGLAGLTFGASMAITGGSVLISGTVAGAAGGYAMGAGSVIAEGGALQDAHEQGTVFALLGAVGGAAGGVFLEAGVGLTGAELIITEVTAGLAESVGSQAAGMALGSQNSFDFKELVTAGALGGVSQLTNAPLTPLGKAVDRVTIAADLMLRPRLSDNKNFATRLDRPSPGVKPHAQLTWRGAYALAGTCIDVGCGHYGGLGGRSLSALKENIRATRAGELTSPMDTFPKMKQVRDPRTGEIKNKLVKFSNDVDWAVFGKGRFHLDPEGGRLLDAQIGSRVIDDIEGHGLLPEFLHIDTMIPARFRDDVRREYGVTDGVPAADYWRRGIPTGQGRMAPLHKKGKDVLRALDPYTFSIDRRGLNRAAFRPMWLAPQRGLETEK